MTFSVDLIITPSEVIPCGRPRRPSGLDWTQLTTDRIAAIPVLAAKAATRRC
jgi:5-formyltetrahydrofolate cyclo-ligase